MKSAFGISSSGGTSTYLRKDGTWGTPYEAMSSSELKTGTATTSRVMRADYARSGIRQIIGEPVTNDVIETIGGTAIKSYAMGDYFLGNDGYYYLAISTITGGSTTLSSTRISKTSIAEAMHNMNASIVNNNNAIISLSARMPVYVSSTTLTSTVRSGTETNICELTIVSAGTYIINAQTGFTTDITSYTAFLIRQNSSNITKIGKDKVTNGDMFNATLVKTLSAGDAIRIRIYQASGSSKTVNNVYLSAIQIA